MIRITCELSFCVNIHGKWFYREKSTCVQLQDNLILFGALGEIY